MCSPASVPFTCTRACQSTAPKCRSSRSSRHSGGTSKERRYQSDCSGVGVRRTPESVDSIANGTRISPSNASGRGASLAVRAYSHGPLRFSHFPRVICGRGYSGQGISVSTSAENLLTMGLSAAGSAQPQTAAKAIASTPASAGIRGPVIPSIAQRLAEVAASPSAEFPARQGPGTRKNPSASPPLCSAAGDARHSNLGR